MAGALLLRREDYEGGITRDVTAGQIPSSAREFFEIMCVTEGGAQYWIEDQHYKAAKGDILLLPAGVMVAATLKKSGCPFERLGVWMSRRFMTFLKLQDPAADFAFETAAAQKRYLLRPGAETFEDIRNALDALQEECKTDHFNAELSTKAMLSGIMVSLNRAVKENGQVLIPGDGSRLSAVLSYIHAHCTQALKVDALAAQFGYSPSHLAHSFKKHIGTSLYHYVLLRRLQIGREAMLSGTPVKEAYLRCGFGDYAGFYRAFTKEFGLSPQQYKKKYS